MNPNKCAIVFALVVSLPGWALAGERVPEAGRRLAAEVRAVFAARCARCHGSDVPRPRGGFGYIDDLRRLSADHDKIVPDKPDESELWQMVHKGEMPPPDSPTGPLTASEKETIRAWIAAGAPADAPAPPPREATAPPEPPAVGRALRWLGKFHLLVVHFPIALLTAALLGELWTMLKEWRVPSAAVRFCVGLGAVGAVAAVGLGWLFALGRHDSSGLLALHRWFGTTAGAWAVVLAVCSELDARRGVRRWWTRVLLLAGAVLVGVAAHFGGLMVHGRGVYDF
jgi:mono/diheme cytochrome c family protein/uncharacterized membrane protein